LRPGSIDEDGIKKGWNKNVLINRAINKA